MYLDRIQLRDELILPIRASFYSLKTSWTPHHTEDLVYLNTFWAIDQFTSPARGPLMGSPLGQTGVLLAAVGLGRYVAPIPNRTDNLAGGSFGYQMFYDGTRTQLTWEVGGVKETKGPENRGMVATGWRYPKAIGQHYVLGADTFVGKREGEDVSTGARTEFLVRF